MAELLQYEDIRMTILTLNYQELTLSYFCDD